jgi:hypothetical protein
MSGEEPAPPPSLDKKIVRTSPVLWLLGVVFALFLGALGTRALSDIADAFHEPELDEFRGPRVSGLERQREQLAAAPDPRRIEIERAERDLADLERTLATAEETWRTWLQTRATLGGSGEDAEVRARRDRLDKLRAERDAQARRIDELRRSPDAREAQLAELGRRIDEAGRQAAAEFEAVHRAWTFKVLSARLALVIPIWGLSAWLWSRRRESKYITLLWGYWGFALWMLLYGIGPYLPHYGGYVPLALGGGVTVWASVSLVRFFNRRAPMRRRRIVDRALQRHICPACDRDYLIGREIALELGSTRKGTVRRYDAAGLRPHACPACGLALWRACAACRHEQLAHLERCAACGAPFRATETS